MTKKEFENSDKALVLIMSWHPETNKVISDYYDYDGTDFWLNSIKADFPEYHTFMTKNPAAIRELKRSHGLVETISK